MDGYLRWAGSTGAAFVPAWNNADVVIVSLAVFALFLVAAIFSGREWLTDIAFAALVVGGILVPWPGMVVLSIAAVVLLIVVSFVHRALRPERSAQIEAEAERLASPRVEAFRRELMGDETNRDAAPPRRELGN